MSKCKFCNDSKIIKYQYHGEYCLDIAEAECPCVKDELLNKVIYAVDGYYHEYTDRNYGNAEDWLRHIISAYSEYNNRE